MSIDSLNEGPAQNGEQLKTDASEGIDAAAFTIDVLKVHDDDKEDDNKDHRVSKRSADSSSCLLNPKLVFETTQVKDKLTFQDKDVKPASVYAYEVKMSKQNWQTRTFNVFLNM